MNLKKNKLRGGRGKFVEFIFTVGGWILSPMVRIMAFILPQNPQLLIFGSMHGYYYGDSAAHLYEWYLKNNTNYSAYWITRSDRVFDELQAKGHPVLKRHHFKAWIALIRARALFFTNAINDCTPFPFLIQRRCTVLYLTHNIAPKKTRHAAALDEVTEAEIKRSILEKKIVTHYISTSPFISHCRSQALKVPEENFKVTGLPRTDILVQRKNDRTKYTMLKEKKTTSKVVLYAPTWRSGREATQLMPFSDLDKDKLSEVLNKNDAFLLIRCHKNDLSYHEVRSRIKELTSISDKVIDATHARIGDINTVLPEVDVLVTDYSGIMHDFLLLDRPIILVPYDLNKFEQINGFFYDYIDMAPGPITLTFNDFIDSMHRAFNNPGEFSEKRSTLRDLIFTHQDGRNCERVSSLISEKK